MNRIVKRLAVPLSAAAVLGTAGFAYMAGNSVDSSQAGSGGNTISGYNVQNITYTAPWGATINAVSFTLDGPAKPANVKATIYAGDPATGKIVQGFAYQGCTATGTPTALGDYPAGSTWTCSSTETGRPTEETAVRLAVNAAQ